ncbi:hypothetical protein RDABS01_015664 [Bienertia sinuspersici]
MLNVPPKVSNFLWRACWDIIPHNVNLMRKRVREDEICMRCGDWETLLHVLRDYKWAQEVWKGPLADWRSCGGDSFREWMALIGRRKSGKARGVRDGVMGNMEGKE